jgi:hypothetical protein
MYILVLLVVLAVLSAVAAGECILDSMNNLISINLSDSTSSLRGNAITTMDAKQGNIAEARTTRRTRQGPHKEDSHPRSRKKHKRYNNLGLPLYSGLTLHRSLFLWIRTVRMSKVKIYTGKTAAN